MKIFNIIGRYSDVPEQEINWHMLQDSTVIRSDNPFFVPDFDTEFRLYPSLAIRIDRLGKSIAPKFAHRYYAQVTLAATVRAENILSELRQKDCHGTRQYHSTAAACSVIFRPIRKHRRRQREYSSISEIVHAKYLAPDLNQTLTK